MSYTPKQQGSGGSGGQSSQQAKTLAGITQQMQNLVHGQNALPQAAQAGLGAFANLNMTLQQQQQQQRFESIIKQQQLLFSANPQFQQHFQQQMQQNVAKEPLALTRSPADLLNKMQQHHQQQANGSTSATSLASNLTNQQLQQQLQAFSQNPANLMQQLQAYQYQMQQQQNQQKMLSLKEAQQSLSNLQAQSVAQQHMQQIQQSLQQQQQKLMASHSKNLSTGNQIKTPVSSNSQSISQPIQSNNNLPNKVSNKSGAVASNQQPKQATATQSSLKTGSNQNFSKNTGLPLGAQKSATSPQSTNKTTSPKMQVNAVPLTKSSTKPPTPPIKSVAVSSPSSKTGISPSSSPKPLNTSIINSKPTGNDTSAKSTSNLSTGSSQVTSVTTPSVTPPKPCTPPAAPVAPVVSAAPIESQPEQKTLDEVKQEEQPLKDNEKQVVKDETKTVEEIKVVEEKPEDKMQSEKNTEAQDKEKEDPKENEIVEEEKPKNNETPESGTVEKIPQTESNISLSGVSESPAKVEVQAENNTQKGTTKPKSNQRRNTPKSEGVAAELSPPKDQSTKVEKKKVPPVKESSNVDKTPKSAAPETPINNDERRSKRHRLKTILYQSPLPELAFIAKLSASEASCSPRNNEEKLTLFYKNEYLAVRNAEGGFFLCQTLQNVYKTSPRIRIRWLSEEKKDSNVYIPDFYDNTDIECVLTTVEMSRVSKNSFRLPKSEKSRIENILKKAIDVEKGILPRPNVTEENPDGLDISLYKNESQIEKKTPGRKRKLSLSSSAKKPKSPKKKKKSKPKADHDSSDSNEESEEETDNDKEYKPSQKKNLVTQPKLRAQRSPLARARAASPITISKELSPRTRKSVPEKSPTIEKGEENNEVASSVTSRSDRAKRRATDIVNQTEEEVPAKKPALTTNQTKKTEGKTPTKAKTNKSEDELLKIQETSKNTSSEAMEAQKPGNNLSVGTKKNKAPTNAESPVVTPQLATGGRTTRSRK